MAIDYTYEETQTTQTNAFEIVWARCWWYWGQARKRMNGFLKKQAWTAAAVKQRNLSSRKDWRLSGQGTKSRRHRCTGRPRTAWVDNIKWSLTLEKLLEYRKDRVRCRAIIHSATSHQNDDDVYDAYWPITRPSMKAAMMTVTITPTSLDTDGGAVTTRRVRVLLELLSDSCVTSQTSIKTSLCSLLKVTAVRKSITFVNKSYSVSSKQ